MVYNGSKPYFLMDDLGGGFPLLNQIPNHWFMLGEVPCSEVNFPASKQPKWGVCIRRFFFHPDEILFGEMVGNPFIQFDDWVHIFSQLGWNTFSQNHGEVENWAPKWKERNIGETAIFHWTMELWEDPGKKTHHQTPWNFVLFLFHLWHYYTLLGGKGMDPLRCHPTSELFYRQVGSNHSISHPRSPQMVVKSKGPIPPKMALG